MMFVLLSYPCIHVYLYPVVCYRRLAFPCKMLYIAVHVRAAAVLSALCLWLLVGLRCLPVVQLTLSVCVSEVLMCNNSVWCNVCLLLLLCLCMCVRCEEWVL